MSSPEPKRNLGSRVYSRPSILALPSARRAKRRVRKSLAVAKVENVSPRSEEHTSELQSLMRISYAVFCLKKKKKPNHKTNNQYTSNRRRAHIYHTIRPKRQNT